MVTIQIFGLKNSSATRAAERFFKERRTVIQFVDLKQKPMALEKSSALSNVLG